MIFFFSLAKSFWELANYNKWQTKNDKLLQIADAHRSFTETPDYQPLKM